jgi:hypothetical protein
VLVLGCPLILPVLREFPLRKGSFSTVHFDVFKLNLIHLLAR